MLAMLKRRLRPLQAAGWLGLQIESNWSDPIVFAVHALAKPLASALILMVMYLVVIGGSLSDPRFVAIYLGNALYMYVILLLVGLSWAVFEDREQYKMLKYVVMTPMGLAAYLLGRCATKFLLATASAAILLVFGVVVLGMRLEVTPASLGAFLAALALGAAGVVGLGFILSGCALVFARQSMTMNEGVSAVLYLLCGVVFPPDLLPRVLQPVSMLLPMTWWLEASRRALHAPEFSRLLAVPDPMLWGALVATTALWLALGLGVFRSLERQARERGLLDVTTAF